MYQSKSIGKNCLITRFTIKILCLKTKKFLMMLKYIILYSNHLQLCAIKQKSIIIHNI